MTTVVLGVYDVHRAGGQSGVDARQRAIRSMSILNALPEPRFDVPDFVAATVEACEMARRGHKVVLCGYLGDLRMPEAAQATSGRFTEDEWREAWLRYLEDCSLGWVACDGKAPVPGSSATRVSIIRSYQRACDVLAREIKRERTQRSRIERSKDPGHVSGRPPYGYRSRGGKLVLDEERAGVVRRTFELVRGGAALSATANLMREHCDRLGRHEFWDWVKVRRILEHAPLYCRGEYRTSTGEVMRMPMLAFLPRSWAEPSAVHRRLTRKRASAEGVPEQDGTGTLGASTPAPA